MKIKLLTIFLILSLLFIGACAKKTEETQTQTTAGLNPEISSAIKQERCDDLTGINKDTCLATLAVEKKDPTLCTQIVDSVTKARCDNLMKYLGVTK